MPTAKTTSKVSKTTVVGYIRVSTDTQVVEGVSLAAQRQKIAAYCVAMDLDLVDIFEDAGYSAKNIERPALADALAALKAGKATGIVVTKLDRLTRSVKDLGFLVDEFFGERFTLVSVGDSVDTRSASGRLVLNVLISTAQWEREVIGERTKEALAQVRREGCQLGALPRELRRGEAKDAHGRRVVEQNPDGMFVVAKVRQLRSAGVSLRGIAAQLSMHTTAVCRILNRGERTL